ncbi:MAG: LysR family transcriptional regulator [Terriglobia bacterium]
MVTLRQLEVFKAIAGSLSFSRAALMLHVAQPSVSQQIRQLEEELGARVFLRSRNQKVRITEAGKAVEESAKRIMREVQTLRMTVSTLTGEPTGEIHIGVGGGHQLTSRLLPGLRRLRDEFPGLHVAILNGTTADILEHLKSSVLDIGIVTFPISAPGLRTEPLLTEEMLVVVRNDHPLAAKRVIAPVELRRLRFVLYDRTARLRPHLDDFFKTQGFRPEIAIESSSEDAMQMMVVAGVGATILPASEIFGSAYQKSLHALHIKGTPLTREIGVAIPDSPRFPRIVDEMLRFMRGQFSENGRTNLTGLSSSVAGMEEAFAA